MSAVHFGSDDEESESQRFNGDIGERIVDGGDDKGVGGEVVGPAGELLSIEGDLALQSQTAREHFIRVQPFVVSDNGEVEVFIGEHGEGLK